MRNVYIEPRPMDLTGESPILYYVVEDRAHRSLGTFNSEHEAVDWAKRQGHSPLVARARQLNDKGKPDHWRGA
jgi:hypothetical protein